MNIHLIKISCGCEVTQGVGFTETCDAHTKWKDREVAAEREACAKIAEKSAEATSEAQEGLDEDFTLAISTAENIASAIRARKDTPA